MNDFIATFDTFLYLSELSSSVAAYIVFVLCGLTAFACSILLLRGYWRTKTRLLFWASVCFACLALNNALVFIDVAIVPMIDLAFWRVVPALVGVCALIYGLVWEERRDV